MFLMKRLWHMRKISADAKALEILAMIKMRILLGGDVMLGRLVRDVMLTEGSHYPLAKIAHLFKRGSKHFAHKLHELFLI